MYLSFKTRPAKGSNKKRKPSKRFVPFGRVREERVTSTVVGFTNCHALELLHHEQNRILTVRENARMQVWSSNSVAFIRNVGCVTSLWVQVSGFAASNVGRRLL
jgi:hypothetical protein